MELHNFSSETIKKAEKILDENEKRINLNWHLKLAAFDYLNIFHDFTYNSGLPKEEFLKRLINIRPFVRGPKQMETYEKMLELSFNKLTDTTVDIEMKVREMRTILEILEDTKMRKKSMEWLLNNTKVIALGLMMGLQNLSMYYVCESCYTSAYLCKYMGGDFPLNISQSIIKGCIDVISERMIEYEKFLAMYHAEKKACDDMIGTDEEIEMHVSKFACKGKCRELKAVNCALYTICFIFDHNTNPKLHLYFIRKIFVRKEFTRMHLFHVYYLILIHSDANLWQTKEEWIAMAPKLHFEISKTLLEPNAKIKEVINNIRSLINSKTTMKFTVSGHVFQTIADYKNKKLDNDEGIVKPEMEFKLSNLKESINLSPSMSDFGDRASFYRKSVAMKPFQNMLNLNDSQLENQVTKLRNLYLKH